MSDTNILIIGNAFDLTHKLPTRYTDFMTFVDGWESLYKSMKNGKFNNNKNSIHTPDDGKMSLDYIPTFLDVSPKYYNMGTVDRFNDLCKKNLWLKYFKNKKYVKPNWVDFEKEIEDVVKAVCNYYKMLPSLNGKKPNNYFDGETITATDLFNDDDPRLFPSIHELSFSDLTPTNITSSKVRTIDNMLTNLNTLIEMLNIYFTEFIDKIEIDKLSPDILAIGEMNVVTFNYTDYIKKYSNVSQVHYVHGKTSKDCTEMNTMVLGINDEEIPDNDYIRFFKYFQRIQKRTGTEYKHWIETPVLLNGDQTVVHIFGHSLANNDKSVLSFFLENKDVDKIVIYYINQNAYEDMIINLVNMVGKDFVIKNVSEGRIVFSPIKETENIHLIKM